MDIDTDLTVPEKILLAAFQLEESNQSPFSAEDLTVAVWQKFKTTFGLKGYVDKHPDTNKVLCSIMGGRGLVNRGWLAKMGQKLYGLTLEGRKNVLRLKEAGEQPAAPPPPPKIVIPHEQEVELLEMFRSTAVKRYEEGQKDELTFGDASRFWGITDNLHGKQLTARLDRVVAMLSEMERLVGDQSAELSNGRSISKEDLSLLMAVHEYLAERFTRHLTVLRTRERSH